MKSEEKFDCIFLRVMIHLTTIVIFFNFLTKIINDLEIFKIIFKFFKPVNKYFLESLKFLKYC